jgi:hypothetical protein
LEASTRGFARPEAALGGCGAIFRRFIQLSDEILLCRHLRGLMRSLAFNVRDG